MVNLWARVNKLWARRNDSYHSTYSYPEIWLWLAIYSATSQRHEHVCRFPQQDRPKTSPWITMKMRKRKTENVASCGAERCDTYTQSFLGTISWESVTFSSGLKRNLTVDIWWWPKRNREPSSLPTFPTSRDRSAFFVKINLPIIYMCMQNDSLLEDAYLWRTRGISSSECGFFFNITFHFMIIWAPSLSCQETEGGGQGHINRQKMKQFCQSLIPVATQRRMEILLLWLGGV